MTETSTSSIEERANAYFEEAQSWQKQERDRKAMECYELALQEFDTLGEAGFEHKIRCCFALSDLSRQQGKYNQGISYFMKALNFARDRHQGHPHQDVVLCHYRLGQLFENIWRLTPAIDHYTKALDMITTLEGDASATAQLIQKAKEDAIALQAKVKAEKQV